MRKIFCDHCGKDITRLPTNELTTEDCFTERGENGKLIFVGYGYELCNECWDERSRLHVELDKKYLNLEMMKDGEENQSE